ncbi:MAG: transposase, partial [Holosporaceae bacterium]|nr:transposase [Holosporaceae bacterium]
LFKKWIADNREKIEIFYLPSYSPERNPDEYFNGTLKNTATAKAKKNSSKTHGALLTQFKTTDGK